MKNLKLHSKKLRGLFVPLSVFAFAIAGFTACDSDEEIEDNPNLVLLEPLVSNYVDNTVVPTYQSLADRSIDLYEALLALKADGGKTDANVQAAADAWIAARKYWEQSEAFLFGAAGDFGIDPHIDTWPLGEDALQGIFAEFGSVSNLSEKALIDWTNGQDPELLGFHGIEYVLFANGQVKQASEITANQLIYATAVAGDLRNNCIQLEASWAGKANVTPTKQAIINLFGFEVAMQSGLSYGANMKNAGKSTSLYASFTDAAEEIIQGCIDIADEVATMKMGKPFYGAEEDDLNYIESPYSYHSTKDFADNIESIRNAYLGGVSADKRKESLHTFFLKANKELDTQIIAAIDDAVAKIQAIPNFEQHFNTPDVEIAIDATNDLAGILEQAQQALRKAVE
jgi:hypothetical protein